MRFRGVRHPRVLRVVLSLLAAAAGTIGLTAQNPPPQPPPAPQTPPVFRGGTSLVPIDVRVVDRNNQPVTDLQQSEFIVI